MRDTGRVRAELRLLVLALLFLSGFVLLGARMGLLAATEPLGMRVGLVEDISGARADITDRNGRVLATNLATHALYAETRRMVGPGARGARTWGAFSPKWMLTAWPRASPTRTAASSGCARACRPSRSRRCMISANRA